MPPRALFFDAAGTLIQVREPVGHVYARVATKHGFEVTGDAMQAAFRWAWKQTPGPQHDGKPSPDDDRGWWRGLVGNALSHAIATPETALPTDRVDALFDQLYAHYADPAAWTVFDDVLPALQSLRATAIPLFIVSNFDPRLRRLLAGHGLDVFFGDMLISSEVGAAKPDRRLFESALQRARVQPHHVWHVGDDERNDVQGATALGIRAFLVERPERGLAAFVEQVLRDRE